MRLCYIANPYSIHTQRQARYFADQGHEIHLISVSPTQGTIPLNAFPDNVTLYDLMAKSNIRKLRYLHWGILARQIVRKIQPDILHAHQVAGNGWVGAATGYHPFIVTAWGSDLLLGPHRSRIQRQLAKWVLQRADYVTCVSEGLMQAAKSLGADPQKLEMATWGIDTDVFHPASPADKQAIRAQIGLHPTDLLVLSIRAIKEVYNPLDIAKAIPLVLKRIPNVQFIIRTYGYDPHLLTQFKAIIQKHHAAEAVQYLGDLSTEEDIANLYRAADVAISIPSSDGTPSSVLEALACGAVPILSDLPTLHKWVQHEQEGLFVPAKNTEYLSEVIIRLITDDSLRQTLSANGVKLIRQRADSKIWMRRNEEIYELLLNSHKRS